MPDYYDKQGQPLEMLEWAKLFEDKEYCIIKQTRHKENGKEFWLSTVWLGLDHNWGGGKPLIFETMSHVFKPKFNEVIATEGEWEWQERYETEWEALKARDPWRVATTYQPDILDVFLKSLKGGKPHGPTKRRSRVLSFLRRSKQARSE